MAGAFQIPDGMIASPFMEDGRRPVMENDLAFIIENKFPISPHHHLIIPKRIVLSPDQMTDAEMIACFHLLKKIKKHLITLGAMGFNIGWNDGLTAGQSVAHVHLHVIPRYTGDVENPRGGLCNLFDDLPAYYKKG